MNDWTKSSQDFEAQLRESLNRAEPLLPPPPSYDKSMGLIIGLVVGDVIGYSPMFTGHVQPYIQRTRNKCIVHTTQPTYPTMMTIANLRCMRSIRCYSKEEITVAYMRCVSGLPLVPTEESAVYVPFLLGRNTRVLLGEVKTLNDARAISTYYKRYHKFANEKCQSGAALSRCASYALFTDGPTKAMDDATITNPSQIVVDANYVYVFTLSRLVRGCDVTKSMLLEITHVHNDIIDTVRYACNDDVRGFQMHFNIDFGGEMRSWVLISLFLAIRGLFHFTNIHQAFRSVVTDREWGGFMSNASLNCAIVGAMLGAKFGMKEVLSDEKMVYNWNAVRYWHIPERHESSSLGGDEHTKSYTDRPCHIDFTLEGIEHLVAIG